MRQLPTGLAGKEIGLLQQLQRNSGRGARTRDEIPCIHNFVSAGSHSSRQTSQQGSVVQLPSPGLFRQRSANERGE
jgi:hypothetical protein